MTPGTREPSAESGSWPAHPRARTVDEPVYRGILGIDIERFGRAEWTDPIRARLRRRLYRLLADAITEADIDPARTTRSDTGDGLWLLVAAEVSTARLLHPLATRLVNGAAEENERVAELERLRLRVVVHAGYVIPDPQGQAGASLIHAARLLDADATRAVLVNSREATGVLITSDVVYDGIVRHGYPGIDPDHWRPIRIRAKETAARAWVHLPGPAEQPRMPSVLENPLRDARHSWQGARRRQDRSTEHSRAAVRAAKRGRRRGPQR